MRMVSIIQETMTAGSLEDLNVNPNGILIGDTPGDRRPPLSSPIAIIWVGYQGQVGPTSRT